MEKLKLSPMAQATLLGCKAYTKGEVPIGAVIVKNDKVIATAMNRREKHQIATHHAEILTIEKACKKLHSWRLDECTLFVTLEPCPMCAGAILNARIKKVVYAVKDESSGAISKFNMLNNTLNHTTISEHDKTYEEENKTLIQNFFKNKRKIQKNNKKIEK